MDNRAVPNASRRCVCGSRTAAHRRGGRGRIIPTDQWSLPQILGRTFIILHLERRSPCHVDGKFNCYLKISLFNYCYSARRFQVLSITVFKSSGFRELYSYRRTNKDYWAVWARQLGTAIQLIPILMIPAVAIIQTCRYLNNGPPDIFDVNIPAYVET